MKADTKIQKTFTITQYVSKDSTIGYINKKAKKVETAEKFVKNYIFIIIYLFLFIRESMLALLRCADSGVKVYALTRFFTICTVQLHSNRW
jgi:hypothetical protein